MLKPHSIVVGHSGAHPTGFVVFENGYPSSLPAGAAIAESAEFLGGVSPVGSGDRVTVFGASRQDIDLHAVHDSHNRVHVLRLQRLPR